MAMVPPSPYDQLTNINRGMPQVAQPATTTQMRPSPPSLRGFMNQHHGHFGGSHFGMLPPGIDPRAVAANPQGYQEFLRQAQQQEQQHPGSTFLGQAPQPGMMPPVQQNSGTGPVGLSQQDLQQKLLSEQQLYSPAHYGGPLNQPLNTTRSIGDSSLGQGPMQPMPFPALDQLQQQYQAAGGTGAGFGQPTSAAMPTQNQYAQGQSSLSAAPQFGTGPTQSSLNQPLQSNNLMQQVGMK